MGRRLGKTGPWKLREQVNNLMAAVHLLTPLVRERGDEKDDEYLAHDEPESLPPAAHCRPLGPYCRRGCRLCRPEQTRSGGFLRGAGATGGAAGRAAGSESFRAMECREPLGHGATGAAGTGCAEPDRQCPAGRPGRGACCAGLPPAGKAERPLSGGDDGARSTCPPGGTPKTAAKPEGGAAAGPDRGPTDRRPSRRDHSCWNTGRRTGCGRCSPCPVRPAEGPAWYGPRRGSDPAAFPPRWWSCPRSCPRRHFRRRCGVRKRSRGRGSVRMDRISPFLPGHGIGSALDDPKAVRGIIIKLSQIPDGETGRKGREDPI